VASTAASSAKMTLVDSCDFGMSAGIILALGHRLQIHCINWGEFYVLSLSLSLSQ
jgi:hypothetical protein